MDIDIHELGTSAMWFWGISQGLEISGNRISGYRNYGIGFSSVDNAVISENTFTEDNGKAWWSYGITLRRFSDGNSIYQNTFSNLSGAAGAIRVWAQSNDNVIERNNYANSGLIGWNDAHPYGPGAIFIGTSEYRGDALVAEAPRDNRIKENEFPFGTDLCQMILDLEDDPATPDYDGLNEIWGWKSCEKMSRKQARSQEKEQERQIPRMKAIDMKLTKSKDK